MFYRYVFFRNILCRCSCCYIAYTYTHNYWRQSDRHFPLFPLTSSGTECLCLSLFFSSLFPLVHFSGPSIKLMHAWFYCYSLIVFSCAFPLPSPDACQYWGTSATAKDSQSLAARGYEITQLGPLSLSSAWTSLGQLINQFLNLIPQKWQVLIDNKLKGREMA